MGEKDRQVTTESTEEKKMWEGERRKEFGHPI